MKNEKQILSMAGKILGSKKSPKKAASSRENGKLGGYWSHKKRSNTDEKHTMASQLQRSANRDSE
jgi:hypothetical protein